MTRTVGLIDFRNRLRKQLLLALLAITLVSILAGLLLPGRPIASFLLGIIASTLMVGTSIFALSKMVEGEELGIGWLVFDYVGKILIVAAALILAKQLELFQPVLVALPIMVTIVVTVFTQVAAAGKKQRENAAIDQK